MWTDVFQLTQFLRIATKRSRSCVTIRRISTHIVPTNCNHAGIANSSEQEQFQLTQILRIATQGQTRVPHELVFQLTQFLQIATSRPLSFCGLILFQLTQFLQIATSRIYLIITLIVFQLTQFLQIATAVHYATDKYGNISTHIVPTNRNQLPARKTRPQRHFNSHNSYELQPETGYRLFCD